MSDPKSQPAAKTGSTVTIDPMKVIDFIGRFVAPTTLLVAVLAYFGWVWTKSRYESFGIQREVLGLTTEAYVFNSAFVVIVFLTNILMIAVLLVWAHFGMASFIQRKKSWRGRIVLLLCIAGFILLGVTYIGGAPNEIAANVLWTAGVGLIGYGLWLAGSLQSSRSEAETYFDKATRVWPAFRWINQLLFTGLLIVGLFVTVAWYAEAEGHRSAQMIFDCPTQQPAVTVYSLAPLTIEAPGVETVKVSDEAEAYQYRYSGLRLLTRSNQKFFLFPEAISAEAPFVIILPDDGSIRVEMSKGQECKTP